jgi:hypothetical protein
MFRVSEARYGINMNCYIKIEYLRAYPSKNTCHITIGNTQNTCGSLLTSPTHQLQEIAMGLLLFLNQQ